MEERKTYKFTFEMEVTATSEEEGLNFVVADINTLHKDGTLGYDLKVDDVI